MKVNEKNRLILFGSLLMISGAGLAILFTLFWGYILQNSLAEAVQQLLADPAYAAEVEAAGLTGADVAGTMRGLVWVLLGLAVAFNVVKIVVGVLGLRRTDRASNFFLVWGVVFLVFGVGGLLFSGVASIFGMCDLAAGLFGPALFLWGDVQNKRAAKRQLAAEREAEEQAAAASSAWPPVRKN